MNCILVSCEEIEFLTKNFFLSNAGNIRKWKKPSSSSLSTSNGKLLHTHWQKISVNVQILPCWNGKQRKFPSKLHFHALTQRNCVGQNHQKIHQHLVSVVSVLVIYGEIASRRSFCLWKIAKKKSWGYRRKFKTRNNKEIWGISVQKSGIIASKISVKRFIIKSNSKFSGERSFQSQKFFQELFRLGREKGRK